MSKVSNEKDTDTNNDVFSKVNNLYKKAGYLNIYGIDLIISIVITVLCLLIIIYFSIINNLDPLRANWDSNKCKPSIIPFAGIINKPEDETVLEFTEKNFINCSQTMLRNIVDNSFKPIYLAFQVVNNLFKSMANNLRQIYEQISNIQFSSSGILSVLRRYLGNLMVPLQQIMIAFKDLFNKIKAQVVLILYSLMGPYYAFVGVLDLIIKFLLNKIVIASSVLAALLLLLAIPFIGWGFAAAVGVAAAVVATLTALLGVLTYFIYEIKNVALCFDPDTKIKLANNEIVAMKDVKWVLN